MFTRCSGLPKHLRVLHCYFKHHDSAALPSSLPPSPPLSLSSDADLDFSRLVPFLTNGPWTSSRFASFSVMMRARGIINANARPHFLYNKIRPKRHPVPGFSNSPAERLSQRRLRDLTPDLWFEDPYLVCILLSLAQLQWQRRKTTPEAFSVRLLVTNASDTTHAHVFQAYIPSKLLHALDNPTEDIDNLVWPAIQHVQVAFEPHASFSERIAGQLLTGLKTRADEEMPRGEKRKRDELDTEEQTKRRWPTGNGSSHPAQLSSVSPPSCLDNYLPTNTPAGATYEP
ncbi:hypothetical protein FOC4_g10004022 [Fusarium odoratissimum]|uniref:Uncharacterized protein n=1 Tax=Fusarium oxysporum f. sp. cubense (strain race 4) TaxID=2502994 RepID=N1S3J8_FUSC4|nr:hypothetical protein FOC4_g10004022 [Fusarium odoratissimum]